MIQDLGYSSPVFLAPMAGITDKPMRKLVAELGGGNIVSEMVAINALQRKNPKSFRIADVRDEPYPVTVQMVGSDIGLFIEAASFLEELGAATLDINMGCPVKKIVNNHSGSDLMRNPELASKIINAVVKSSKLKVSVKFRKGWDNNNVNAIEFAQMCQDSGARHITIHGRTRGEFYSGTADWDIIAKVKEAVQIPVIGNGDITSAQTAQEMINYTKVDGVMVGRAALGAPWLIGQIHDYLTKRILPKSPSVTQIKDILFKHIQELTVYYGEKLALPLSRKYVCWYCKNMHDARKFREKYVRINNFADAFHEIDEYFNYQETLKGIEE